jgi:hypothetical protein
MFLFLEDEKNVAKDVSVGFCGMGDGFKALLSIFKIDFNFCD